MTYSSQIRDSMAAGLARRKSLRLAIGPQNTIQKLTRAATNRYENEFNSVQDVFELQVSFLSSKYQLPVLLATRF